jgi:purine-binding chemotaxis protein CheW
LSGVHVRLRIGSEVYALPVENVLEIAELGGVSPVPGAGPAVLGVRNLRGQVLPVFDLAAVFGLAGSGEPSRVVVAEEQGRRAGLAIDEVTDVGELPETVTASESSFLSGTALDDGTLVGVIDVRRMFAALERGAGL